MPLIQLNPNRFIIFSMMLLGTFVLKAQQLPLYSDYLSNGFLLNPAITGSERYTIVTLANRVQWAGIENPPETSVASFQTRIQHENLEVRNNFLTGKREIYRRSGRVGWGLYVFNDSYGLINRTGGAISYAYHITTENVQYSMGLSFNTFQFSINQNELNFLGYGTSQGYDPILNKQFADKVLIPDAAVGFYMLTIDEFFGCSINNLFDSRIHIGGPTYDYRINRTYYLLGGKHFDPETDYSLEPSFMVQATGIRFYQADLMIREYYKQDYFVGLVYRTGSAIGLQLGGKWERLYFSYAFDYTLSSIQSHTYGSHELTLSMKFGDNARRYRWLIRF